MLTSVLVDGLRLPVSVTSHPALDFCNTRAGWGSDHPTEYLHTYQHLLVWGREAELIAGERVGWLQARAQADPVAARSVLGDVLALREALYAVALGLPEAMAAFPVVAGHARVARVAAVLRPAGPGQPPATGTAAAEWTLPDDGIDTPLLAVAAEVDDLLCSPLSGFIAACAGPGCGWLFADPRRRRRWCDMAVCGNREKARRYAERKAGWHA